MDLPVVRPASTVLPLRDAGGLYEVLMLRRSPRSEFVAGAYVFPGGALDDADETAAARVVGWDEPRAKRQGFDDGGLAYVVAGLRELFEEAGLLVARDAAGRPLVLDADLGSRLAEHRARLNDGSTTMREVLEAEDLFLDASGLVYLAHWVTPVGPPRRYDTRFFCVRAPSGQWAANDEAETVDECWIRPVDALAAYDEGRFDMVLPTVSTLRSIADLPSVAAVLAHAREIERVERVEPRVVERDGALVVEAPGIEASMAAPEAWRRGTGPA